MLAEEMIGSAKENILTYHLLHLGFLQSGTVKTEMTVKGNITYLKRLSS